MAINRPLARRQVLTVVLLFAGFAAYYFCRSDFSVAMPLLIDELHRRGVPVDVSTVRLGATVSFGVLAYALGKLFLTGLGDRWGGRISFLIGLAGAIGFTLLFAGGSTLPVFTAAWIGNRLIQSIGWAGLVKICSQWFDYTSYGTVLAVLSLSFLVGDAAARQWMGALIQHGHGWRDLFYLAAVVAGVVLLANLFFLREARSQLGFPEPTANPLNVFHHAPEESPLLAPLLANRRFWIVCFLSLGTTIIRESFNAWTPTYLHSYLLYSDADAARGSSIFPAVGVLSVLAAGWLGDRLGPLGRSVVLFGGMLVTTLGLYVLASATPHWRSIVPLLLIGVVSFGLLGPYSYLAGAMALDFGGRRGGATSSGIIDGVGYLGAVLAGDTVARIAVHYSWGRVFLALGTVAAVSAAASGLLFFEQRRTIESNV